MEVVELMQCICSSRLTHWDWWIVGEELIWIGPTLFLQRIFFFALANFSFVPCSHRISVLFQGFPVSPFAREAVWNVLEGKL